MCLCIRIPYILCIWNVFWHHQLISMWWEWSLFHGYLWGFVKVNWSKIMHLQCYWSSQALKVTYCYQYWGCQALKVLQFSRPPIHPSIHPSLHPSIHTSIHSSTQKQLNVWRSDLLWYNVYIYIYIYIYIYMTLLCVRNTSLFLLPVLFWIFLVFLFPPLFLHFFFSLLLPPLRSSPSIFSSATFFSLRLFFHAPRHLSIATPPNLQSIPDPATSRPHQIYLKSFPSRLH